MSKREEEVSKFWKDGDVYAKLRTKLAGNKKFYFLDGPPYATGKIHMGTAWNKILKDCAIRFWRMKGFDVWDQPGYDTHGLPIENKVEKKFSITSKDDIERMGVEEFVESCREFATEFIDVMSDQFENLGVWMNWKDPYITLKNDYIEGAWHTFKIAYEKGLLYQGLYPVHVCPRCETAVAYNEIEYTTLTDPSIYVKFKVRDREEYLVIWTTTPWTLAANSGIMAKPDADYVRVQVGEDVLVLAKELLDDVMSRADITEYKILEEFRGKDLEGLRYGHPMKGILEFQKGVDRKVVLSDRFVTLDEGTGLVHTAPGHGQEDYKVGKEEGLEIISPVTLKGTYKKGAGPLSGKLVKSADKEIIDILRKNGALLHHENVTHEYPQCWRCDTPLLQMAVKQWFFRVTKIRDSLLEENKKVNWYPDWAKLRFSNWLENLGDWPISRQRYWGIPLPIWTCEKCDEIKVIGSSSELPEAPDDLHRPYIDEVKLKCKCGGEMSRIKDVLDVWFDSGLASWASIGYPENEELFGEMWPADLNIEGPDQIRGWWNSQLITSMITFGRAPFESIVFHGFVLDSKGLKMSKSRGNIVAPEEVIKKHGRDVLRLYLLSGAPWEDFCFKWHGVDDLAKSFMVMENVFNFVKSYVDNPGSAKHMKMEDLWLMSRLNSVTKTVEKDMKHYNYHKAVKALEDFILNDFSRWYIKIIRDRVRGTDGEDKKGAFYALHTATHVLTKLLAPITPYMAERVYQKVCNAAGNGDESVHLAEYPKADEGLISSRLESGMKMVQEVVEIVNSVRKEKGLKLRWPLEFVSVESGDESVQQALEDFGDVLKQMANVKDIRNKGGDVTREFFGGTAGISTEVVKDEALLRELMREIQSQRKKAGLVVEDRIELVLDNEGMKKFEDEIRERVGAEEVIYKDVSDPLGSASLEGESVSFSFRKL